MRPDFVSTHCCEVLGTKQLKSGRVAGALDAGGMGRSWNWRFSQASAAVLLVVLQHACVGYIFHLYNACVNQMPKACRRQQQRGDCEHYSTACPSARNGSIGVTVV